MSVTRSKFTVSWSCQRSSCKNSSHLMWICRWTPEGTPSLRHAPAIYISELQKLPHVTGQPCELGKNNTGDMTGLDVTQHPLSFGRFFYRLSAHGFQSIYLLNLPALRLGIVPRPPFMVLRTLALRLILGGNPDPDADMLGHFFFNSSYHLREPF